MVFVQSICITCTLYIELVSFICLTNYTIVSIGTPLQLNIAIKWTEQINVTVACWQDSSLIITGSADKNIKIWGLDYGDCHKSIFGHDDRLVKDRSAHE